MVVNLGDFSAYTSDRNNCFEWEVIIYKNGNCVDLLHKDKKPTEESLMKILKGYVEYGKNVRR